MDRDGKFCPAFQQILEDIIIRRGHKGLSNSLINPSAAVGLGTDGEVPRALGGLLRYYDRDAP